MLPDIRHRVEPVEGLGIEVGIPGEAAAVEEALAHVAHGALDLPLGLGPIGATRADPEAPVGGEAQELGILEDAPAQRAAVFEDDGLQLIEEQLGRDAPEVVEGRLEPRHQRPHRLARIELEPEEA